jgi:hypothetical protein
METIESRKGKRGIKHEPYKTNPFMPNIPTKSQTKLYRRGNMALINTDTGEIHEDKIAGFWEAQQVDATKFVKLYINGVKALAELTSAGTKVFEILYLKMQELISRDQVHMSFASIDQDVTPISKATYMRGLAELVTKGFLAASHMPAIYWINPSFLWNGDRLTFVKQYYKQGSVASMELQQKLRDEEERLHQQSLTVTEATQEEP